MASSTQKLHHQLRHLTTAAPPPTPSTHSNNLSSSDTTSDALFHLLHRLPPTLSLSLPTRRPSNTTATPPVIPLSDSKPSPNPAILSAATQLGFFQVSPHTIPSHLHLAAESSAASLFNLPLLQKQSIFPNTWPLGYHSTDDDNDDDTESFCLDSSCSTESSNESGLDLDMDSLRNFNREMEKLGLEMMEELALAGGFRNPTRGDPFQVCSLMWISKGSNAGRVYPYVVGMHYQLRSQKCSLLTDSGRVDVLGLEVDSVLMTIGDIAQVWSNGKFKKVRGRPMPSMEENKNTSNCITMSLLITLPLESTVSPRIPHLTLNDVDERDENEKSIGSTDNTLEQMMFRPFSFEDYAWRIYHERLHFKDTLVRYRV